VVNDLAMDAVEGVAPEAAAAEAAPEADAVAAEAVESSPAADDKPAEPEFDEVWFPGGRRPDNPRHSRPNRRPQQQVDGAAPAEGEKRERHHRPRRDNAGEDREARPPRPEGKDRGPRRDGGGRPNGGGGNGKNKPWEGKPRQERTFEDRPRREKAFDPDSPFAALAALRNPKSE
jgi:ATP-dependent RNA helicase SUPV3L1/SUV3